MLLGSSARGKQGRWWLRLVARLDEGKCCWDLLTKVLNL
uniref:Uncharacterized protein n=1 Tax=Arundo donax TaxID=35708 RepID=A0A0A8XT02_ARUDO